MPLLNIIGVSGMNTTTHLGHCFLRGETTADYVWVLTALKTTLASFDVPLRNVFSVDRDLLAALNEVFSSVSALLCLWHIIKAVQTHARQSFLRFLDKKGDEVPEERRFYGLTKAQRVLGRVS